MTSTRQQKAQRKLEHPDLQTRSMDNFCIVPPLVSVVVGVYNHEQYVEECLDSIVGTSYPNLQILVFDDASTDKSDIIIRNWIGQHPEVNVAYCHHNKNVGLTRSLNGAVRASVGSYFCYISGDDAMLPHGISARVEYLVRDPHKLAVFADCHVVDENGKMIFESAIEGLFGYVGMRKKYLHVDALMPYNIVFTWAVPGPAFMCRKELFNIIGLYDESLMLEDWDMYMRIAFAGRLGFCDAYVAQHRVHAKSVTSLHIRSKILTPSLIKTIDKQLPRAHGLIWLRLYASRLRLQYTIEPNPLRRRAWQILSKPPLTISKRLFLVVRYVLYFVHRRAARG